MISFQVYVQSYIKTKEFFLIESIKICYDLNNENKYLCLQLNYLNQIKFHKNHFLYLKWILLHSRDLSLNPGPIQNDNPKQNWKTFRNSGLHFLHLNINNLLRKIDEVREIVKISNQAVTGITKTKLDNSIIIQKFPSTDTVPFEVIKIKRVKV